MNTAPILEITNLEKHFPIKTGLFNRVSGHVFAVDGVSLSLNKGETLGLVGEADAANQRSPEQSFNCLSLRRERKAHGT